MTKEQEEFCEKFKEKYTIEKLEVVNFDNKEVIRITDNGKSFGFSIEKEYSIFVNRDPVRHGLYCALPFIKDNRKGI